MPSSGSRKSGRPRPRLSPLHSSRNSVRFDVRVTNSEGSRTCCKGTVRMSDSEGGVSGRGLRDVDAATIFECAERQDIIGWSS